MNSALPNLIPQVTFQAMSRRGPIDMPSDQVFAGKNVMLFGLVGAFTPSCHYLHLPAILDEADTLKASGIDTLACTSVNDIFVLNAWARASGAGDEILFLADGNGDFARGLDLLFDGRPLGLGFRSKRYVLWANQGIIQHLMIEADAGQLGINSAPSLLATFMKWANGAKRDFWS